MELHELEVKGLAVYLQVQWRRSVLSYKLVFPCSDNEVEYEALILGLYAAEQRRISNLKVRGDSKLVVS